MQRNSVLSWFNPPSTNSPTPGLLSRAVWFAGDNTNQEALRQLALAARADAAKILRSYNIHRTCQSLRYKHLLLALGDSTTVGHVAQSERRHHRGLWICPLPGELSNEQISHLLFSPDGQPVVSDITRMADTLRAQWGGQDPHSERFILWYCMIRVHLRQFSTLGLKTTLCLARDWTQAYAESIFLDGPLLSVPASAITPAQLPKTLPLVLRQLLQDTWIVLQQLTHQVDRPGMLRIAEQHLSQTFRHLTVSALLSARSVAEMPKSTSPEDEPLAFPMLRSAEDGTASRHMHSKAPWLTTINTPHHSAAISAYKKHLPAS